MSKEAKELPIEEVENKIKVRELEKEYVNLTIRDLEPIVQKRREEFAKELEKIEAMVKDNTDINIDDKGKIVVLKSPQLNAVIISELLFKPISNYYVARPNYTAEKLQIAFDLYREMIVQANMKGLKVIPTKTHFSRFCGFSTSTYDSYMESTDLAMRNLMEVIDDYFFDTNISSAQNRELELATTMFRSKVEQRKVEAVAVQTHVITPDADMEKILYDIQRLKEGNRIKVIDYDTVERHNFKHNESKRNDKTRLIEGNK